MEVREKLAEHSSIATEEWQHRTAEVAAQGGVLL